MPGPHAAGSHDDPIDAAFEEQVDVGELAARIVGRVAQQDRESTLMGCILHRADDFGKVRILDIGHQQPKGATPSQFQGTGRPRWAVVEIRGSHQDTFSGRGRRRSGSRQDAADGGDRDARGAGHVAEGRARWSMVVRAGG